MLENENIKIKKRSQGRDVFDRFKKNKVAILGMIVFILLILMVIFADCLADYEECAIKQNLSERLRPPSREHIFGTDEFGRDLFARIVHGSRISISIGIIAVVISLSISSVIGAIAGYFGGIADTVIMRITDVFLSIPFILLCISIITALGSSTATLLISLTIAFIPGNIRIIRASAMTLKDMEFVQASVAIGAKSPHIIKKHILINVVSPIIVQASMGVADAIVSVASLSFIGLGTQPPIPEWGGMLSAGSEYIRRAPHVIMVPGIFLLITTLSLNLLGDGLRDALDPKLR